MVNHIAKLEELRNTRRRFWVQVPLTLLLLALIGAILGGGIDSSEFAKKAAYVLLGAIVVFWLK